MLDCLQWRHSDNSASRDGLPIWHTGHFPVGWRTFGPAWFIYSFTLKKQVSKKCPLFKDKGICCTCGCSAFLSHISVKWVAPNIVQKNSVLWSESWVEEGKHNALKSQAKQKDIEENRKQHWNGSKNSQNDKESSSDQLHDGHSFITIRRRLCSYRLSYWQEAPAKTHLLKKWHVLKRLQFSKEHTNWPGEK